MIPAQFIESELKELRELGRAGSDSQERQIEEIVGRIEYAMRGESLSDRDEWKRLATERNVVIGTLGQENERLRESMRSILIELRNGHISTIHVHAYGALAGKPLFHCKSCERIAAGTPESPWRGDAVDSAALRPTPSAWMRGVSSYIPGEPTEYDVEVVPDCDGPPEDGKKWIALYRRAEDVK